MTALDDRHETDVVRVIRLHRIIQLTGGTYTLYFDSGRVVWRAALVRSGKAPTTGQGASANEAIAMLVDKLDGGH
jgi:hypothetical protein